MARKTFKRTYKINHVKNLSNRARYEYWRERGVLNAGKLMTKQELDTYTDEQIWRLNHPGREPVEIVNLGKEL